MEETPMKGGKGAWMAHVKKTMRANKGKSLMQVLKMAKKTYKKSKKGGALSPHPYTGGAAPLTPASVGGRRRRGGRKSRGTRKH
jgi:hypothetical protein